MITRIRILLAIAALMAAFPAYAVDYSWDYNPNEALGDVTYDNITNFLYQTTENSLKINVMSNCQATFGSKGRNFTIYKTSSNGAIVQRLELGEISLRSTGTNAQLQFGGNGVVYTEAGLNGGSGAEDAWEFLSGKTMTTDADLYFQSGGNGSAGVAGKDALNGGAGGAGGISSFKFNKGSATFNGVTYFGGHGGAGGVGSVSSDKYYATKGGAGGDGGLSSWTVTDGDVTFNNVTFIGGMGGQGGNAGLNTANNVYAEHGTGGLGGNGGIDISGGTMTFQDIAYLGGTGGYSEYGTGGAGGDAVIYISGGTLSFNQASYLGGSGGESIFGTGGMGGLGYISASGGTLNVAAGTEIGGTGGSTIGTGAAAGKGGETAVYLTGAKANFSGTASEQIVIGGAGGTSRYAANGTGGKASLLVSGGVVTAKYVTVGGTGGTAGEVNQSEAGAGGEAVVRFNGGEAAFSNSFFGGTGGDAYFIKATAGAGGKATVIFDDGNNTFRNVYFGGSAGTTIYDYEITRSGADGGEAVIKHQNGVNTFENTYFGGRGGDIVVSDFDPDSDQRLVGGSGGKATLTVTNGSAIFKGATIFGGSGGGVVDELGDAIPNGTGGNGGAAVVNISGGMTSFKGNVIVGGTGGIGSVNGAGGAGTINITDGMLRVESTVLVGGLTRPDFAGLSIDSDSREFSYKDDSGIGTVTVTGGILVISQDALLTSSNMKSAFKASGGSLLFNIDPDGGENQRLGAIVMPSIVVNSNAQLGITMDEWKEGKYTFDTTNPILVAETSNSLKVDSNSFESLFYTLETYQGAGIDANKWYLKSVIVNDMDEVWAGAGETVGTLNSVMLSEEARRDVNNIFFQAQNYEQLNAAADQLAGAAYADAITTPLQRVTSINQIVMAQVMQVNGIFHAGYVYDDALSNVRFLGEDRGILANNKVAPWGGYYGGTATTSASLGRTGFDNDSHGFIVGLDLPVQVFRLGGYYAFGSSGLDTKSILAGKTHIKGDDHLIGLYMKWNALMLTGYWGLTGNYGYSSYKSSRALSSGTALASYGGSQWGIYLERGWSVPIWLFNVNPHLALQYESISQDAFSESGTSSHCFDYDKLTLKSFRGIVGLRGIMNLGTFKLTLNGSYIHEMGDENPAIHAVIVETGDSMTVYGLGNGRDWFNGGAGVTLCLGPFTVMANYNLMLNGSTTFHSGMATLKYKF